MSKSSKKGAVKRASGCTGKTTYTDINKARQVARHISRMGDGRVDTYRCIHCNGFHLGHNVRDARPLKDL